MGSPEAAGHLSTDELFRQHAGFVARFLGRLGVPEAQLEDALQEVFLVAHRNGGYRPGLARPTSYLANIAIRAAARHRHREGRARTRHSDAPVEQMPGEHEDPARALQVRQDLERLQRALERLPEELATTLVLVELEGESCVSVAAGLGCPVGTIYWRLHQARKQLQSALRVVDRPRSGTAPAPAELDAKVQPARSWMVLLGLDSFSRSEASRLLQLAREQPSAGIPVETLLARHQQLVTSGAELPAWASSFAPHGMSWLALLGAGPITAAVTVAGLIAAAALSLAHAPPPGLQQRERELITSAQPARAAQPSPPAGSGANVGVGIGVGRPADAIATSRSAPPTLAAIDPKHAAPERPMRAPRARSAVAHRSTTSPTDLAALRAAQTVGPEAPEAAHEAMPEPAPAAAPKPAASSASDAELAEMREVARAERLLADDPERALAVTRAMQTGFPKGYFREERAYLELMALAELGRASELRERAAVFLRSYPDGVYSGRVRKAVASRGD